MYSILMAIHVGERKEAVLKLRVREVAEAQGIRDAAGLSRRANIAYATAHRLWNDDAGSDAKGVGVLVLYRVARALNVRIAELLDDSSGNSAAVLVGT